MATEFEKTVEKSFAEYLTTGTAYLQFLHPRMRVGGFLGKVPAWIQVAKAPYDVDGYYLSGARYIACEIKENGEHHNSLKIIPPEKKGTGLQYHQLEALVNAHKAGAVACVLWNNGGEVGYLDGSRLAAAKSAMDTSLKAEKEGYPNTAKGSRSIPWGNFKPVKLNGVGVPLWLPAPPAPSHVEAPE